MKKFIFIIVLVSICAFNAFAFDLRQKAEENPLDCSFYLIWKDKDAFFDNVDRLAYTYFELGLYSKNISAINLLTDKNYRFGRFVLYSTKLLESANKSEANKFINFALKNIDTKDLPDDRSLIEFANNIVALNRSTEAVKFAVDFTDEDVKEKILITIADSLLKHNQIKKTKELTSQPFFPLNSKNNEIKVRLALIFAKLKFRAKAEEIVNDLEKNAFVAEDETEVDNIRREILLPMLKVRLELGEIEKAMELWEQHYDSEDYYRTFNFVNELITYKYNQQALTLINQSQATKDQFVRNGSSVVKAYLKLGDVSSAITAAKNISKNNDNYSQQEAFIILADKFIEQNNFQQANEILDAAWQKARKIVFEHHPMDSNGASSGTRKITYLSNIYNHLMKLKEFDKAFQVINSIESEHYIAKEFMAESYVDFAKQRIKTLPKNEILSLLTQAQNFVKDDDYDSILIKVFSAEVYILMNEKNKALDLFAQVLREASESCCYEDDFLIKTGKLVEKYKLKANPNLKKALQTIISSKY